MDFLTLQKEVGARMGLDYTNSTYSVLIKRWINTAQQFVFSSFNWPFLRGSTPLILQTVPDYTTGTATVAAGGTTVTFSGTITDSKTNQYIQFASSNDWYRITAHTAGTSSATISPAAISANTAATYTIRKFYYSTSSDVDRVIQIKQSITPYQLTEVGKEYFEQIEPDQQSTGTPYLYRMAGFDSSGYPQFQLWPTPDAVINLYVDYLRTATDLSSDSDVSVIPAKWHTSVLTQGALAQGYEWDADARYKDAQNTFLDGIERMKEEYAPSLGRHRVMRAIDEQPSYVGPIPFPDRYPALWPR
jgi:hypothetical protein